MGNLLDVLKTSLADQIGQYGNNAQLLSTGRKALSCFMERLAEPSPQGIIRRLISEWYVPFGHADDTPRPQDAQALVQQAGPDRSRHEAYGTGIDQIKALTGEIERLQCVHHLEGNIMQPLYARLVTGILDHGLADVEADYFLLRVGESHLLRPATRPTGNIQDPLAARDLGSREVREESSHTFGDEPILIEQAGHLPAAFRVDKIGILSIG